MHYSVQRQSHLTLPNRIWSVPELLALFEDLSYEDVCCVHFNKSKNLLNLEEQQII